MIYFIAETEYKLGRVKIGYTDNIKSRISDIKMSSPSLNTCVLTFEGDRDTERELHEKFSEYRIFGEWFNISPEVAAFICSNLIGQGRLEPHQEDSFCEFIGANKDIGFYEDALDEVEQWGDTIHHKIKHNGKEWAKGFYRLVKETVREGTMGYDLQDQLPCTGKELLVYLKIHYPEVKRPQAYVRGMIRNWLNSGQIIKSS